MFIDEAIISVAAGKGGDGSASFRREKYIPKGGPDGGDGGKGGHVYIQVKEDIHGLAKHIANRSYQAENGQGGMGQKKNGRKGRSITVSVPPGTLIFEQFKTEDTSSEIQENLIIDTATLKNGEEFMIARGGRGGLGNVHFKSSTNQAPREFTKGTLGQRKTIRLEVRHIADVGLVGLPNAGKSSLVSRLSNAKPKIANYPFTTLEPHLGAIDLEGNRYVLADIPGLIEGASQGKGLGHKFLKHLQRTKILLHLISADSGNLKVDYETIRKELKEFSQDFINQPEIIIISKVDLIDEDRRAQIKKDFPDALLVSSVTHEGLDDVVEALKKILVWNKRG